MTTITLNSNPISYYDAGSGPAVVLIPGWNEDHRMYKYVAPILARRYRVLSLDWRGHGEDRTHHGDFTIDDMASDIVAFIDALGLQQVATVSSSHGSWANVEAAQRLGRGRIAKIVLVSWRLTEPGQTLLDWCEQWQQPDSWQAGRQAFFDYSIGDSANADVINHIETEMTTFGIDYWHRTGREIAASYHKWSTPMDRLRALDEPPPITHVYTLPHDVDYVSANNSFATENDWYRPYRLPGETHFPVLENPAAVSRIIHEFLADIDLFGAS